MLVQPPIFRFGPFELSLRTRELCKHGIKLKLRPQPFQVLTALVERAGDVVTREELRELLWSSETFVDFEQGLNTSIKELRAVLNDTAEAPQYVATVPKVGYRIIVPVHVVSVAESSEPELGLKLPEREVASAEGLPSNPNRRLPALLRWPAVAGIVAALLIGLASYWRWSRPRVNAQPAGGKLMLAVLPFENLTGDAGQEYFSDGLTEEMISQLARIDPQQMGVIARTSVMHYKQNPKPLEQVGRELGVEYVLEGSVRRDASTVRISAQLIQLEDQTHLWSRQYDRELNNLLVLQAEIAQEIADEIQLTLGNKHASNSVSRPANRSPVSYDTYDLYLKGRYNWNKRSEPGFHQAAGFFQQAIDKDPNYAQAYAGLADTFALLSTWNFVPAKDFVPRARFAALKALEINDNLAEAHASLGLIAEQFDYDWQTAEKEFRRAIQLDPSYATAHQWYAECLSFQGRFDEAFAESDRARQLDPLSLIIAADHAVILYYSRKYDRAIEQFLAVRDMEPDFPRSQFIVYSYLEEGKFAEALDLVEKYARKHRLEGTPDFFADEAYVYGRWGRQGEAQRAFVRFEEQSKLRTSSEADPASVLLRAFMGVGRKDDAIAVLQKGYAEHTNLLVSLKVGPFYDPLRNDARFQDLMLRAHLR